MLPSHETPGAVGATCPKCRYDLGIEYGDVALTCPECGLVFTRAQETRWRRGCKLIAWWHTAALGAVVLWLMLGFGDVNPQWLMEPVRAWWYAAFVVVALVSVGTAYACERRVRQRTVDVACAELRVICGLNAAVFVGLSSAMVFLRVAADC